MVEKKVTMHIDRKYKITSKKIKEGLGIEGEITSINLWQGRSPMDIEQKISADNDQWEFNTKEIKED